jgi:hypothetical protein
LVPLPAPDGRRIGSRGLDFDTAHSLQIRTLTEAP